ncbi:hypothetical protein SELMODRAFT_129973 [Selaginella moellendorffii]|uniref:Pentacotripeptide-repeat region of PRORP domain-containing protein n=1 Tax=Selaginella moellendorffii TaxID=88036 RepID=D8T1W7_SELML|nr:hypothetical protein SELMODRAFT_129973 [Selaginella moellendorffii]
MQDKNVVSWTTMLSAYSQNSQLDSASQFFANMPLRNVVSWNAMITAYAQSGHLDKGLRIFDSMPGRDLASWTALISAPSAGATLVERIYSLLPARELVSGTAAIAVYSRAGNLDAARSVFDSMPEHNAVSFVLWTSMISAFAQNNLSSSALQLFHRMLLEGIQPDVIAYTTVLDACGVVQARAEGKVIHSSITDAGLDTRAAIASSLITMYSKWGCIDEIEHVFDKVVLPNVVVWTALISAYAHNGHGRLALHSFARMDAEGVQPDHVTFISVVDACASIPEVTQVRLLHDEISCWNLDHHPQLQNALLSLYSKCGCVDRARIIFERLPTVGVIPGSAMLQAYAENGHGHQTLSFFRLMVLQGVHPENVTFLSILSACSHAGLVEVGCDYFASMKQDYEVEETVEHFTCMVDLFARSGKLEEAEELIGSMPFQPEDLAWLALLAGCRSYGHVERGIRAASRALELNPTKTSAPYVLLSGLNGDCK